MDSIFDKFCNPLDNVYLKIDVEGFERCVLGGAEKSLEKITGVQIEILFCEQYEDQMKWREIITFFETKGFVLYILEVFNFSIIKGKIWGADAIFFKR